MTSKKKKLSMNFTLVLMIQLAGMSATTDYYYQADLQFKTLSFVGSANKPYLSIGFWISAEMKSGVICPFLNLAHSGVISTETFELRTETASTYAVYADGSRSFSFVGSTSNDSFVGNSVIRKLGISWNYVALNYVRYNPQVLITYAVNSQIGYFFYSTKTYSLTSVTLKFGSIDTLKNCRMRFRINKLEVFYNLINMLFGSNYDPIAHASKNYNPFTALYKLNMSPFARNFVNLLNFDSGNLIAVIISPQKSKTALHFPRTGDQLYRYTFGISPIRVFYDSNVTLKSPTVSSYTFVMTYRAFGTNYLAKHCRTANECLVPDYKFVIYSRSNLNTSNSPFISAMRSWSFKELVQDLQYRLDENINLIYKEDIILPNNYNDFDLTSGVNFLTVSVDDFVLKATPFVQICFYIPSMKCTNNQSMKSEFREDDIHITSSSNQPSSYYIYIFVGEISFHGGTGVFYESATNTLWDSTSKSLIIFSKDRLDLKRVFGNSFFYLRADSSIDVGIYNCFDSSYHCEFCQNGVCMTCMIGYELLNYQCYTPQYGCDYLTRKCDHWNQPDKNILENINLRITKILFSSDRFPVSLNISFKSKINLGIESANDPTNLRTYSFFFNSLESLRYNPLVGQPHLTTTTVENQFFKLSQFYRLRSVIDQFEMEGTETYLTSKMYLNTDYNLTKSLFIFEDCLCFDDIVLYLIQIEFNLFHCYLRCSYTYFYNTKTMTCEKCMENCETCSSADICLVCNAFESYILSDDNKCVKIIFMFSNVDVNYEKLQALFSKEKWEENLFLAGNVVCSMGYVKIGDQCEPCSIGCLECQINKYCLKCDANYRLTMFNSCEISESVVKNLGNNQELERVCDLCFQTINNISPGCKNCHEECQCSLTQMTFQNSFSFKCPQVTFSSSHLEAMNDGPHFSYQKSNADNTFILISKSNSTFFSYTLDLNLVLNTSNCFISPQKVYSVNQLKYVKANSSSDNTKLGQNNSVFVSNDLILLTLSIISGPIGNIMIGLLQFNKIFVFLSLSDAEGGQFFQFININLYASKQSGTGFRVHQWQHYEFLTEYEMRSGDKMASKFTIILFSSLIALQQLMFIVSFILSRYENNPKLISFRDFLIQLAFKLLRAISYRYNNIIIASLSFLMVNIRFIESYYYKSLYIALLLLMVYYPVSLYDKALSYIKSTVTEPNSDYSFFDSLNSPGERLLNQALLKNRLFDELVVIVKSFLLYHCRKYKDMLLIIAIILNILEFLAVIFSFEVVKKSFTMIKLLGIFFFTIFTVMMLFSSFSFEIPQFLFEVLYLASNLLKLIEVVSSSIFVMKKNYDYKQSQNRIQPAIEVENVY
jgi:hypothetical protein